jgi:pyruvate, water dikinase
MASARSPLLVPLASAEAADAGRFGPKAANLARLGHAGLPIPGGFCVGADAYRAQFAALGLTPSLERRDLIAMRIALHDAPITAAIREPLLAARCALAGETGAKLVVRSSALIEDRAGTSFAGQFESYLGLEDEAEFETAVRACWAALWSPRVLRYMQQPGTDSAFRIGDDGSARQKAESVPGFAMALLVQPLVAARVSGGALSRTLDGDRVINASSGLGASIAQGEVVPERIVLTQDGRVRDKTLGRALHRAGCEHAGKRRHIFGQPSCLSHDEAEELGQLLIKTEELMGGPVEIEWARDDSGFKLLQARPLHVEPAAAQDEIWLKHPGLSGQPAGVGWSTGRACVVSCECELSRVFHGDILVTRAAGPALGQVLTKVAGVVTELGGSTSHLASLARERGVPMVLGVAEATERIPDGVQVAVDGVAGIVRWMR